MDFKTNLWRMAWPNTKIAPNSGKFGLVDPHRLLTWVWSTPKQAIPLIWRTGKAENQTKARTIRVQTILVDQIPSYVS